MADIPTLTATDGAYETAIAQFDAAAAHLGYAEGKLKLLRSFKRELTVNCVTAYRYWTTYMTQETRRILFSLARLGLDAERREVKAMKEADVIKPNIEFYKETVKRIP